MTHSVNAVNQALCADAVAFIRQAEADYRRQLTAIADHIAAQSQIVQLVLANRAFHCIDHRCNDGSIGMTIGYRSRHL